MCIPNWCVAKASACNESSLAARMKWFFSALENIIEVDDHMVGRKEVEEERDGGFEALHASEYSKLSTITQQSFKTRK